MLRFWLGEDQSEVVDVHAGEVLHIPSGVPHKAEALEQTLDMDIFCPPRQDWLDGTDSYLRVATGSIRRRAGAASGCMGGAGFLSSSLCDLSPVAFRS